MNSRKFSPQLLWVPFLLLFFSCAQTLTKSSNVSLLTVDESLQEDNNYLEMIAPYKDQLDKEMGVVIASGAKELKKNVGESPLGNLVADMQRNYSEKRFGQKIDISVVNNGGLRNSLPEGDITVGNVFELAPFENFIYLLELAGNDVENLARYAVKGKNLGIAGLNVESKDGELTSFTVGGAAVKEEKTYILAINDYLANGGDNMNFLVHLPRILETTILMREMLFEQMEEWTAAGKPIDAEVEGRQKLD